MFRAWSVPRPFLTLMHLIHHWVQVQQKLEKLATVIVSATFGHLQDSSLELNTLKPCPIWITPY